MRKYICRECSNVCCIEIESHEELHPFIECISVLKEHRMAKWQQCQNGERDNADRRKIDGVRIQNGLLPFWSGFFDNKGWPYEK
jgi:hypothetical protein